MNYIITVVKSAWDNTVVDSREHTWEEFVKRFRLHVWTKVKEQTPMIVPCSFLGYDDDYEVARHSVKRGGGVKYSMIDGTLKAMIKRGKANVKDVYMLALDFDPHDSDDDITIEEAMERFIDYKHFGYTSFGHETEKKFGKDAFRLFIPLSRPMPVAEYMLKSKSILEWVGNGVDLCTTSVSRGFFIPSLLPENAGKNHMSWDNDGKSVDPDIFVAEPPRPEPVPVVRTGHKADVVDGKILWNTLDIVGLFKKLGLYQGHTSGNKHLVICPWEAEHSFESSGTMIFEGSGISKAGFNCMHGNCVGKSAYHVTQKVKEEYGLDFIKEFYEVEPYTEKQKKINTILQKIKRG